MHAADVKSVFRTYSIDVPAREKDDLKEDPIVVRLRKVIGPMLHLLVVKELTLLSRLGVQATTVYRAEAQPKVLVLPTFYPTATYLLAAIPPKYYCHIFLERNFLST